MTEQRFRGGHADELQDFYVRFVFSDAPINIGVLTYLEGGREEDFSVDEVIDAALVSAAQIGAEEICKEADEVTIDDVVVSNLDAVISRIKEREAA